MTQGNLLLGVIFVSYCEWASSGYLNGDGWGYKSHLSLFFVIMHGDFNTLLKWLYKHKVSIILVDQTHCKHVVQTFKPTPEFNSFQQPKSDMNIASGCPQFAELSVLEDPCYVINSTMFIIKCIVDASKIFHPYWTDIKCYVLRSLPP